MTTTTMDLHGASTSRADRKPSTPGPFRLPTGSHVSLVTVSHLGETARGKPPPAYLERLVHRTAWLLCAVAVAWVFGADLARWVWSLIW